MNCDVFQCTDCVYPPKIYSYENVKSSFTSTFRWKIDTKRIVVVRLDPTVGVIKPRSIIDLNRTRR